MSDNKGMRVGNDNNNIHHNTITDSEQGGIVFNSFADDNSVHNNIVTGSGEDGIELGGDDNDIIGNFVCDNSIFGGAFDIRINASADGALVNNNIFDTIANSGTNSVIENNSPCPNG